MRRYYNVSDILEENNCVCTKEALQFKCVMTWSRARPYQELIAISSPLTTENKTYPDQSGILQFYTLHSVLPFFFLALFHFVKLMKCWREK